MFRSYSFFPFAETPAPIISRIWLHIDRYPSHIPKKRISRLPSLSDHHQDIASLANARRSRQHASILSMSFSFFICPPPYQRDLTNIRPTATIAHQSMVSHPLQACAAGNIGIILPPNTAMTYLPYKSFAPKYGSFPHTHSKNSPNTLKDQRSPQ